MTLKFLVCIENPVSGARLVGDLAKFAAATAAEINLVTVHVGDSRDHTPGSPELLALAAKLSPAATAHELRGLHPAEAIVAYAHETRPDLIALATHARGAMSESVLGSTAKAVMQSGVAPVLLFRAHEVGGILPRDVPVGVHVFTSDGRDIGTVDRIANDALHLHLEGGGEGWVDAIDADTITTGELRLAFQARDLVAHLKD